MAKAAAQHAVEDAATKVAKDVATKVCSELEAKLEAKLQKDAEGPRVVYAFDKGYEKRVWEVMDDPDFIRACDMASRDKEEQSVQCMGIDYQIFQEADGRLVQINRETANTRRIARLQLLAQLSANAMQ